MHARAEPARQQVRLRGRSYVAFVFCPVVPIVAWLEEIDATRNDALVKQGTNPKKLLDCAKRQLFFPGEGFGTFRASINLIFRN